MITPCVVCGKPCIVEVVFARSDQVATAYCEEHQAELATWLKDRTDEREELERAYYSEVTL